MISEKRQKLLIIIISIIGVLGSLSNGFLELSLYFQRHAWQLIAVSIANFIALVGWLVVLRLATRKHLMAAAIFLSISQLVFLVSYEALLTQPFLESIIAGTLIVLLGGLFTLNKHWWLGVILAIFYAGVTVFLYQFSPFIRFDTSSVAGMGNYFYILAGLVIFIVFIENFFATSFFTSSIQNRLLVTFIIIVMSTSVIITVLSLTVQQYEIRQNAYKQLDAVATLKQAEINTWLQSIYNSQSAILANQSIKQDLNTLILQGSPFPPTVSATPEQTRLHDYFNEFITQTSLFNDFFVVNKRGDILFSLDSSSPNLTPHPIRMENLDCACCRLLHNASVNLSVPIKPAFFNHSDGQCHPGAG
jgi:hypothetical protein